MRYIPLLSLLLALALLAANCADATSPPENADSSATPLPEIDSAEATTERTLPQGTSVSDPTGTTTSAPSADNSESDTSDTQRSREAEGFIASPAAATDPKTISVGASHSCAVHQDGTISCWGSNGYGELGNGVTSDHADSAEPVKVLGIADATTVATSGWHACALHSGGNISCWGNNENGQLASEQPDYSATPIQIEDITDATIVTVGALHSCALHQDGTISCWGSNEYGQLGSGQTSESSTRPVKVWGIADATSVSASKRHTCALHQTTTVSCWGANDSGQLGNGQSGDNAYSLIPVMVSDITNAVGISTNSHHSCALFISSDRYYEYEGLSCWGDWDQSEYAHLESHACEVNQDGTVSCWGTNENGQLGNGLAGFDLDSSVPVKVQGISDAIKVAAGDSFSCAVHQAGSVSCWGNNDRFRLGNDLSRSSTTPIEVKGISGAIDITAGSRHACAIHGDYEISCWGANDYGQLGNGQTGYSGLATPVRVKDIDSALLVTAGENHTCAIHQGFTVACWGANDFGQLGNGQIGYDASSATPVNSNLEESAIHLAVGSNHTCALTDSSPFDPSISDRTIYCWGANYSDQLGRSQDESSMTPIGMARSTAVSSARQVSAISPVQQEADICACEPAPVADISDAVLISAGSNHTCAIRLDRTASCWGANDFGQLGNGSTGIFSDESSATPRRTAGIADAIWIAAGGDNSCALHLAGAVSCWGNNNAGQLGNGQIASASTASQKVADIKDATSVAAGTFFSCALRQNASISCWGANSSGELGIGQTTYEIASSQVPVEVDGITDARAVDLGWGHACALHSGGSISCWGDNEDGQLGNSQTAQSHMPLEVEGISDAVSVSTGLFHTCVVRQSGSISCWGLNSIGQLGNGRTDDSGSSEIPVRGTAGHESVNASLRSVQLSQFTSVIGITDASSVAAGGGHTCALHQNGIVSCWGNNESGQLGNDRSRLNWNALAQFSAVPVQVEGITDAIAVDAGAGFSCALHETGSVSCWGDNEFGGLGNGQMEDDSPVPVPVEGINDATAIATGGNHACAIHQNGAVSCWGGNSLHQRGTNQTTLSSAIPVSVSGISDAAAVSAGGSHTCILHQDGTITCMGVNLLGELGNLQVGYSVVPVRVVGFGE